MEQTTRGIKVYFYMHTSSTEPGGYKLYEYDNDLKLILQKDIEEDDIPGMNPYYYISGTPYYSYEDFFTDFDDNKSSCVEIIEYDDFVLFVSAHYTFNEYERVTFRSTIPYYWHCNETVYTAYSYDGEIIWRATADSTDYEALQKQIDEVKKQKNPIKLPEGYEEYVFTVPLDPDVPID